MNFTSYASNFVSFIATENGVGLNASYLFGALSNSESGISLAKCGWSAHELCETSFVENAMTTRIIVTDSSSMVLDGCVFVNNKDSKEIASTCQSKPFTIELLNCVLVGPARPYELAHFEKVNIQWGTTSVSLVPRFDVGERTFPPTASRSQFFLGISRFFFLSVLTGIGLTVIAGIADLWIGRSIIWCEYFGSICFLAVRKGIGGRRLCKYDFRCNRHVRGIPRNSGDSNGGTGRCRFSWDNLIAGIPRNFGFSIRGTGRSRVYYDQPIAGIP
jgi:hypothetical protein